MKLYPIHETMTVKELNEVLSEHGKPVSKPTLYKFLNELEIKPISKVRQIPQRYPGNAADRILAHLGVKR